MSKWTKGPWRYGEDMRGRKRVFAPDGREIVRALSMHGDRRLPEEERAANAILIASAPALVEALEKITIYRVEEDDRLWLKINGVVICATLDDGHSDEALAALARFDAEARAALSLAKGTQGETK